MKKDFTNLLFARINKKEVEEKHPEWLVEHLGIKLLKNEIKEKFKDILLEKIIERAREENYYLLDYFEIRETENSFFVLCLAYPKFIPGRIRKLKPPKIEPEKLIEIFKNKLSEIGISGVSSEGVMSLDNTNNNGE